MSVTVGHQVDASSSSALHRVGLPTTALLRMVAVLAKESWLVAQCVFQSLAAIHLIAKEVEHVAEIGRKIAEAFHLTFRAAGDQAATILGRFVEEAEEVRERTWVSIGIGGTATFTAGALLSGEQGVLTWQLLSIQVFCNSQLDLLLDVVAGVMKATCLYAGRMVCPVDGRAGTCGARIQRAGAHGTEAMADAEEKWKEPGRSHGCGIR